MKEILKDKSSTIIQEPELTLHDYWLIISRNKLWIIFSTLIVLACTIYYNYSVIPQYTATATLLIKTEPDKGAAIFDFGGGMSQSTLANQMELLKSRKVANAVAENLWESKHRNNLYVFGSRKFFPRGQRPRRINS